MNQVTVVICNYNYARFLGAAIDSALAQDYPHVRVLVIDDGSTDGSRRVIESYGSRIAAVFKSNGGQGSAYNCAISLLESGYAVMLDADDVLYPTAVSRAVEVMDRGYAKAQFRLDVMDGAGRHTGTHVPHSDPPETCGDLLAQGWLYPSPPASGHVYQVSALKRIFPVPDTKFNRYGADFYAIYGVALQGRVASIPCSLGGYRIHQNSASDASFANSEDYGEVSQAFDERWSMLRQIAAKRIGVVLPSTCHDFAIEKARFCSCVYHAPLASRWHWLLKESGNYLHTVIANPFWGLRKKMGTLVLSSLCLLPFPSVSDFAVRYIVNPASRRRRAA
ncbi:glycosyltransferase family A protein [Paraburkholderia phymatum]|uniref:Glycosyl transferase family 2 n=1 Tax=Paraburkholderia phymatum (strain DSM 17167 / CIP 108236 / LMG 21445 / STM815) TaxID=391038 RepID=B2JF91_PARP8|nr:glycosyltransferase family A protein [Paraburkholderia phymatum]ACC71459.1 glycosyl transferase family 2 [Paraburkholderia phymatum STM815]